MLRVALGRLGFTVVSPNINDCVHVQLSHDQPKGFRIDAVQGPRTTQRAINRFGMVKYMLPEGKDACDLRAIVHKVFALRNITNVPLAFYKKYVFKIKDQSRFIKG